MYIDVESCNTNVENNKFSKRGKTSMENGIISQLGASPETLIDQMRNSLNEIIAKSLRLKPSKELDRILGDMRDLYFKLNMAKLTNDKTILSITGLQGVGKTKIIRDLYQLDDSLLPSDGGRGEVLPVLFTETNGITAPTYYVRRAFKNKEDGLYRLKDIEISLKELNDIAADSDKNDLWLEVRLPHKYFNTEISLALLPGFENDKNQFSQKYLETFLTLSTSVLLVFNHKKLAQMNQQLLIERVASDYRESAPIFALSFAEELNVQQRADLKNEIGKKFDIPDNESDRIVFTGTSEDLKDFPKKIVNAIYNYSLTNASGYTMQMRMLASITNEIRSLTTEFETELNAINTNNRLNQLEQQKESENVGLHEIREAFREFRSKVTNDVRKVVNKTLTHHANNCTNEMNSAIGAEKNNAWDKFKSAFNKNNKFEEKRKFQRHVKNIWNGDHEVESERRLIKSLDSFVSSEANFLKSPQKTTKIEVPVKSNPLLPNVAVSEKKNTEEVKNKVIETALTNIDRYMNPENNNDLTIALTKTDLKVLPLVAIGIAQEIVAASLVLDTDKFDQLDLQVKKEILDKSNSLVSEFKDLALSASTVVKGAAIFFGIDALDGTFNTFGALTGILTSLGVSSSAAAPIGLLIVGTIGSALAIQKGSERIEKYKFERSKAAEEIFKSFANAQENSVIATINNILDKMEEKLIDTYHLRRGTDKNFGLLDELDNRLNRLQNLCGELQELAFRNESYIYSFSYKSF